MDFDKPKCRLGFPTKKWHRVLMYVAIAMVLLFFFPNLLGLRTMGGLEHEIQAKWIANSAGAHGSFDDFVKLFGKPDRVSESNDGYYLVLQYQCSDGILVVLVWKNSPDLGTFDISGLVATKKTLLLRVSSMWNYIHGNGRKSSRSTDNGGVSTLDHPR